MLALLQAKTSIPGLGKPITAVDVTYDGAWVLATTDDYLMVVKASFSDEDGEGIGCLLFADLTWLSMVPVFCVGVWLLCYLVDMPNGCFCRW
jgi:hypothetical protein